VTALLAHQGRDPLLEISAPNARNARDSLRGQTCTAFGRGRIRLLTRGDDLDLDEIFGPHQLWNDK
jgi:hypothetical protein